MWNQIAKQISQVVGSPYAIARSIPITGGSINEAYCLIGNDRENKYFVKLNQANQLEMFETEVLALQQMHSTNTILVPKPIVWGIAVNSAFLVMEWLELGSSPNWQGLADNLAALHRIQSSQGFGWQQHNRIGSTLQLNHWSENWLGFFTKYRIGYQLQLAYRKGFPKNLGDRLLQQLPKFFENYQPQPSLVHGDLWSGNMGFSSNGNGIQPVIFDPAIYYGDREVDIAMTELFGGFAPEFYQAYQAAFPLDSGYQQRKHLYNLYHLINHFNLFGGTYAAQAERVINKLLSVN
jgi:fructosamine-3-kinase